jgi:hypothetical protein
MAARARPWRASRQAHRGWGLTRGFWPARTNAHFCNALVKVSGGEEGIRILGMLPRIALTWLWRLPGRISSSLPSPSSLEARSRSKIPNLQVVDDGSDDNDDESVTFSASRRCSLPSEMASPISSQSVFPDLRPLAQMSRGCRPCVTLEQCDVICRLIYLVF